MGNLVCDDYGMLLDSVADCRQLDAELGMDGAETKPVGKTRGGAVVPSEVLSLVMESGLPAWRLGPREIPDKVRWAVWLSPHYGPLASGRLGH